ncbi:MFS transporter [Actinomadura rugatobispora]|uniref:Nitrate/nitrite transporter n=1 Tax=Actinomadura rugatobispora TaxID=1994 RepID=A0ABW0ZXK4_9ACTN|nr:nitrate transporter NarK [Actinomadura rugatobispora]
MAAMDAIAGATAADTSPRGRHAYLALAAWAVLVDCWAWTMIGPLAPGYAADLGLSTAEVSLLSAVPLVAGALGGVPVGALTDRYGGQVMLAVVGFLAFFPVLYLAFMDTSFTFMVAGALALGVAGTAFAVGVPFCNAWYEPARRGLVAGVVGAAASAGIALSALLVPWLADAAGRTATYLATAAVVGLTAAAMLLFTRDAPGWQTSEDLVGPRVRAARRLPVVRRAWPPYALAFGGFLAMPLYLPTYLREVYGTDPGAAAAQAAAFALGAVVAWPAGGFLADRIGPRRLLVDALGLAAALTLVITAGPAAGIAEAVSFTLLAFALGVAAGGVFALVARCTEPSRTGAVTGLAWAVGVPAAFVPALLLGAAHAITGSYVIGLLLLACAALAGVLHAAIALRR